MIEVQNLTKRYSDHLAVNDVTFTVAKGQILGLLGPNGAGKSTTMKIITGFLPPGGGKVTVAGYDIFEQSLEARRHIGYLPENPPLYVDMSVTSYLDFVSKLKGVAKARRKERLETVLQQCWLTDVRGKLISKLSKGYRQRVGLAGALIHDPEVLILDEPANGLDPQARIEMRDLLLRLARMGKTLVVTSHILPELSRICDVVAIITQGKLRAFGTLDRIMRDLRQRRTFEVQLCSAGKVEAAAEAVRGALAADEREGVATLGHEGLVRFDTALGDAELSALLAALVGRGVDVAQFREVPKDLEDAFLTVTRREPAA